ncbi:MAG: HAMP domain-containing protein [Kiritimatiellaceae bacterium]|nr:HAMP domain-containing protein [Kiritimatiellaceae bacterium]
MQTRRIFWQIYPGHLIITFFALLVCFAVFTSALERFYRKQVAENLESLALFSAEQVRDRLDANNLDYLNDTAVKLGAKSSARVTLILPDGTVAGESAKSREQMENHRDRPEVKTAIEEGRTGQSTRFSSSVRKSMLYVAVPVYRDNTLVGVVRMAMPLLRMNEVLSGIERSLLWGCIVVLLLAALLSLFVSRRISKPLENIRQGAERFAAGDFSYRLRVLGSAEVGALAETMNQMAEQLEERLQTVSNERNQREAVLSSMVEGVLAVDTDGHIISLNKAAAQFFNVFQPETAAGRSIEEVFRNVKLQRFVAEVLEGQETRECELAIQNHQAYYLQACGTNLLGAQNRRIGAVVVFNDVSRLRRLENLRRDFVANVSHELKTPITTIKGFVETLLDGAINDSVEAERFLKIVAKHADRLNAIIEDLLMLSRLEQGGKEGMEMQKAGLCGLMNSAVEVCARRAAEKNITICVECPEELTSVVNPPLVEQALINLIGNAVKYSADGKNVVVSAHSENGGVVLSVKDQGYGIEKEHLERLFERFYRVDKGRSRQEGGTGLGLSIVKHIAQAHGGTVSVQSRYGEGSTFSVFLPAV